MAAIESANEVFCFSSCVTVVGKKSQFACIITKFASMEFPLTRSLASLIKIVSVESSFCTKLCSSL